MKEVIHILEILCGFFGGVTVTVVTFVIVALRWDNKKKGDEQSSEKAEKTCR